MTLAGQKACRT